MFMSMCLTSTTHIYVLTEPKLGTGHNIKQNKQTKNLCYKITMLQDITRNSKHDQNSDKSTNSPDHCIT